MKRRVLDHIQRRKRWRLELLTEASRMMNTPNGNADEFKGRVHRAAVKVALWHGRRAQSVLLAVQRRVFSGTA